MKKNIYAIVLFTSIVLAACAQSRTIQNSYTEEPANSISYQQFYDDLSPYGQWIDNPEFGQVWAPRESGFQPYYSNGNWAYTNYGWTWVSDYNWGWATFHYGRWFYDNSYGWMWVPGYDWAPAWVSWRQNSDYYGWAPLCPRRNDGSYYEVRNDQWAFVPHQYITRKDLVNYYITRQNNSTIINNTTIVNNTTIINNTRNVNNNTTYQQGPPVAEVEKATNTTIRPLVIKQSTVPGNTKLQNGVLQIYKPVVKQTTENESSAVPLKSTMPPNRPQTIDKSVKIISPGNNITTKPADGNLNPLLPEKNQVPVVRENPVKNEQDGSNKPGSTLTTTKDINSEIKQLPDHQPTKAIRQNPVNVDNQTAPINQDDNKISPKRIVVAPTQNPQPKINQRIAPADDQQQQPAIRPRPSRPAINPSNVRSQDINEKRFQTVPQNPPANLNRENNGGRPIRINR